jgi:hypothetical protein
MFFNTFGSQRQETQWVLVVLLPLLGGLDKRGHQWWLFSFFTEMYILYTTKNAAKHKRIFQM